MILLRIVLLVLGLLGAARPVTAAEPYLTGAPATTAVLGRHAARWASPPALAIPHIKAGTMRPPATWGATRPEAFPEGPTLKELGDDADEFAAWWEHDASVLADVVKRIGRVESK